MPDFRDRFREMAPQERDRLVAELEDHVTIEGRRLLETAEIEELLTLLPAGYFRAAFKAGLGELRRRRDAFPELVVDFEAAAAAVARECQACFSSTDRAGLERLLEDLAFLRLAHPALWYRVYVGVRAENLGWALELEPSDRARPFRRP